MDRAISRRDFLNGAALIIGGTVVGPPLLGATPNADDAPEKTPGYYPPALTGMRGNHDGYRLQIHVREGRVRLLQ